MCGLAGFVDGRAQTGEAELRAIAKRMGDTLYHRGPDDEGVWVDAEAGLALAHRRLSIVDLSPLGHQPMVSSCGRFVIAYNGEVYNFAEMRRELEALGRPFRSHSDTEVILEGAAVWGLEATLSRLIGMFAVALWDRAEKTLILARDRLGIKPLYWGKFGTLVIFGSELKALVAQGNWTPQTDRSAVAGYLRYAYVPAPLSIYQGVAKLAPGSIAVFRPGADPVVRSFWSAEAVVSRGIAARQASTLTDGEAIDQLEALLKDAVGRRMVADVPLGAFLSGGIDSSVVVALMQAQSERPVKTFSIGFHAEGYDEAQHAKAVAAHLGTEHTELYVEPAHALEVVPKLAQWYDEPFADSSQIPTYLVSEMTRGHVTVALSGDGGDELFAGYNRYTLAKMLSTRLAVVPPPLRRAGAAMLKSLSPARWDRLARPVPARLRPALVGDKLHKLAEVITQGDGAFYRRMVSQWPEPETLMLDGAKEPRGPLWDEALAARLPDFLDRMQYLDLITYLPDDILTKVDRASMAVALEARVPLIDHRVVEFAWSLPQHMKLRGGVTKWLLRQVLYRHVPRGLIERPKMGFGVPIDAWLRGPLRDWAEALLTPIALDESGLAAAPILEKWREHQTGVRNWHSPLWTILMYQAWRAGNAHS
jgi:asparagine synthase (glutamine-hydrolysing)